MAQERSNGQILTVTNTQIHFTFQNISNTINSSNRKCIYVLDCWLGRQRVKIDHHLPK